MSNAMLFLTPRQHQLLTFMSSYAAEHHIAPTLREMREGLGYKDNNGPLLPKLKVLERRGYIRRPAKKLANRNWEVVRLPDGSPNAYAGDVGFVAVPADLAKRVTAKAAEIGVKPDDVVEVALRAYFSAY